MLKKLIIILVIALMTATMGSATVMAQTATPENPDAVIAAFDKEPPFTEADVETFIKIAPALIEAVDANDETKAVTIMENAGWNEIRGAYVTSKIGNGYLMLTDPEDTQTLFELVQMPASLIPGEGEMALIQKYQEQLAKIFQ